MRAQIYGDFPEMQIISEESSEKVKEKELNPC